MIEIRPHENGIVELCLNRADHAHNVLDTAAVSKLAEAIEGAANDARIKGLVISSAKDTFVAGGDINEILAVDTPQKAIGLVDENLACLRRLETCGKPVVALIDGTAVGGGLELAMACHYRICSDNKKLRLGLPEVGLGLMPGAGGTQRLPYLVGARAALDIALGGRPMPADQALELGLIDEVVASDKLLETAIARLSAGNVPSVQPWDRAPFEGVLPDPETESGRALLGRDLRRVTGRAAQNDPAPAAIVSAMIEGLGGPMDRALKIEQGHFARIISGRVAKNKIRTTFLGVNAARKMAGRPKDIPAYEIHSVGVVGAGLMGSGIAHVSALAGYKVFLLDISQEAAAKGRDAIARKCAGNVAKGRMTQKAADALVSRIVATTDYSDLQDVDIVVEAVSEQRHIKDQVIAQISSAVRPGVPVASNTSTIPISALAEAAVRPADFIGLHFFAPVDRMQFVEVIKGAKTDPVTLARALDYMAGLRKTVVVVGDGIGFFTSRVVAAYTGEALTLVAEGVDPRLVDTAALNAGMPIGPLAMADMTSLSLLKDIFGSIVGDGTRQGLMGMRAVEVLNTMVDEVGRMGRTAGQGLYNYPDGEPVDWPGIASVFAPLNPPLSSETIEKRLLYAQSLETIRAIEEGVVETAADADVGSVTAWAFPAFTGGVVSYVDGIGTAQFAAECDDLADRYGERFRPPQLLRDMAARNQAFHPV